MELGKKQRIHSHAKNLRLNIANVDELKQAISILFKGEAEVSFDNDGQIVIYTGHSYGLHSGDVTAMVTKEFLDA